MAEPAAGAASVNAIPMIHRCAVAQEVGTWPRTVIEEIEDYSIPLWVVEPVGSMTANQGLLISVKLG